MEAQQRARTTARLLVNLTRDGDLDGVAKTVRVLADPARTQRERLRQMLTELLNASAGMVLRQTGGTEPDTAIVLDLRRFDGSTVDIDELRPEVRAVVRALLAEVNNHPGDTSAQLDLALDGETEGLTDGITLVLLWTVSAIAWCEENHEPAPGWLATTAA